MTEKRIYTLMNRYQKIALIVGALALFITYGKTITKVGVGAVALIGKEFLDALHRGKTSLLFLL
jgi:hypothetical protein